MAGQLLGRTHWAMNRDDDGHRNYQIQWLVKTTSANDGPQVVLSTPGLPTPASYWLYGNDNDPWAFCRPNMDVTPVVDKERNVHWLVDQVFSTKPLRRCQTTTIENPLNEPLEIAGSFVRYTKAATHDRNGVPLKYSNHQLMKGPAVEFDANRPTVQISGNFATLDLGLIAGAIDTLNDDTLWGLSARKVKLSNAAWSRRLYGTCTYYYNVRYEFDIDFNTFDRDIVDEGTMILSPCGDASNPKDYIAYKDSRGVNQRILLNGAGAPLGDADAPVSIGIEYYGETNLLLLGIPGSL